MAGNVTQPVLFDQLAYVDDVMRTRGWNARIAQDISQSLGVSLRTVYRIRNRCIQWTRRQLRPADLDRWRVEQVQFLADTALQAREKQDYSAAAKCIDIQAKIIGTIAPTKVDVHSTTRIDVSPAVVALVAERSASAQLIEAEAEVVPAQLEPCEDGEAG